MVSKFQCSSRMNVRRMTTNKFNKQPYIAAKPAKPQNYTDFIYKITYV
jgi:hypothetical protein